MNMGKKEMPKLVGLGRKGRREILSTQLCPIYSGRKAFDKLEGTSASSIKPTRPCPACEGGEVEAEKG